MENKRKEAIEEYSKSIKGHFDYTVESAHITGFMAGYDAATSGFSGIGSLYDPRFGGMNEKHNHVTRDIKPLGQCPACNDYHDKHIPKKSSLERIRDELAEKICPYDPYHSGGIETLGFKKGWDARDVIAKEREAKLVEALKMYESIPIKEVYNKYPDNPEIETEILNYYAEQALADHKRMMEE